MPMLPLLNAVMPRPLAALFADDATVEDPVGSPQRHGRKEIHAFYAQSVTTGAKLELLGEPRCAGDYVAFPFAVKLEWQGRRQVIEVIDTFRFNDAGRITEMRAFFGPANMRVDAALAAVTPDDISDIMFTSGTTGVPKGVLMTHGGILPQVGVWIGNTGLAQGERYLIANPFFHSFGMKVGWVACLLAGAVMVPMPQFDLAEAIRLIEQERIAFLPGPPTIFQMLLAERDKRAFDCSSLRGGTTGAATVPPVLIERIRNELGMKDIITAYGMTECVNITSCRPGDPVDLIANTCGAAIPGNEVIIAGDDGRELPRGEIGEIRVRGTGVMKGYLDDPAATAEAIDAEGWLHTGDVGTMDEDGYVRITDRMKDMFISGGFNVYPAEVEKLLSAHPAVTMVAVIGVPDERMGEVGKAFVVTHNELALSESELIAWARKNIANYKVPRRVEFVAELPRNASGKIEKIKLAKL
jgi:acyl-CoA synthetase (AMP-forming)/AMP-acid ligase II